MKCSYVSQLI